MSRNKLTTLFLISVIAVLSGTVAYAQTTVGMGMHQTTPTLPDDPSTIFQSHLNNIMGIPYNNTAGEMVTPEGYDPGTKHYIDVVAFEPTGHTFICPNGNKRVNTDDVYSSGYHSPINIFQHNNEHADIYNQRAYWQLSSIKIEAMHTDIHDGLYHVMGIAHMRSDNIRECGEMGTEELVTFDLFGVCDGSEAHMTVREANSWSITFNDEQHSAACLTAPSP